MIKEFAEGSKQKYDAQNGSANYHNDNVPQSQQRILDDINTKSGNAKILNSSINIVKWNLKNDAEAASYIVPAGEGLSFIGKQFLGLTRYSPKAKNLAIKFAESVLNQYLKENYLEA